MSDKSLGAAAGASEPALVASLPEPVPVSAHSGDGQAHVPSTVRVVNGPTILLRSGEYFDFLDPEACTFWIQDIAHGLSNICRFAGHCRDFYSVAQHSVYVSQIVPPHLAFAGLMHDAAEAFIGDVAKPLKVMLPEYKVIEDRVETALFARYGLPLPMDAAIKEADIVMLATEQRDLMRNRDDWEYCRGRTPADFNIKPMSPKSAFAFFMARFDELTRDSDASLAEDPKGLSGEAVAARAGTASPNPLISPKEAELVKPPREYEVSKADAILAALPTTDGAGMQEACAQIADAAKDIWERERASETDNDSDWYLAGKRDCARDIAREIRALPLATPPTTDASERMREALNGVMVGGNHLAHVLIGKLGAGFAEKFPPETDPQEALRALCATDTFEIWCCWRTIMLARAKVSALPLFDEGRL